MDELKRLIKNGLTDTDIRISARGTKILSKTCFWVKENFSAIIKHKGVKFYCYFNRPTNDIIIERM
jgi:hypothetical protein